MACAKYVQCNNRDRVDRLEEKKMFLKIKSCINKMFEYIYVLICLKKQFIVLTPIEKQ